MGRALEKSRNTHCLHMGSATSPLGRLKKKETPKTHINQAEKHTANSKSPDKHSQIGTWCLQLWGWRNLGLGPPKAEATVPKAGTAASEGAGVPSAAEVLAPLEGQKACLKKTRPSHFTETVTYGSSASCSFPEYSEVAFLKSTLRKGQRLAI